MNDRVYFWHADKHQSFLEVVFHSFWVCVTRQAQSTHNKMLAYLCNSSRKTWGMKFIFCLQINMKVFYDLIVSPWLCVAKHAQSTQKLSLQYLFNISWKVGRVKLIFCLHISIKYFFKLILSF